MPAVDGDEKKGGKRRSERTDGLEVIIILLLLLVAFLDRTEHPFCYGLVADTEFYGSVQD